MQEALDEAVAAGEAELAPYLVAVHRGSLRWPARTAEMYHAFVTCVHARRGV